MVDIVTGAAGFIGSHLVERLVSEGREVVGIDNFYPYYSEDIKKQNIKDVRENCGNLEGSFEFVEGDILKDRDLEKLPRNVDKVFHEAAIAGVRNSIKNPVEYTRLNVLGTSKILKHFDEMEKFVFAGSSSVYGEVPVDKLPVREDRDLNPIAPYPLSKVQSEEIIKHYNELYGIGYAITRYFTVYGPRQRPDEAFTKFMNMVLNGEPVTVYGDGEQSRDFTHVHDVVEGTFLAGERGRGIYNIGSGRRVTVNEMVSTIDKVYDGEVEVKHMDQPEGDVSHTHSDITKAEEEIGYTPSKKLEEGTRECLEWVKRMKEKRLI